ncbi:hypothetical protein XA68_16931 [Ophiocordyceps unilateralis]|uniref:CBM20 domain-containing protein n=1 Tax=Ophiocordyceps unilateralis TaxID=268505 RepID=A0A2A9PKM0_OPHUN|nr:hypothetical protein XA68_16931 [Ophiocordyceps unilateralis]
MRLAALAVFAAALAPGVSASESAAAAAAAAAAIAAELQANYSIDWNKPPARERWQTELTCFDLWFKCPSIRLGYEERLVPVGRTEVSVYHTAHVDNALFNTAERRVALRVQSSTAIAEGVTSGWSIAARVTGGPGPLRLSMAKNEQGLGPRQRKTTTRTKHMTRCDPRHDCRIETWTFHVKVSGTCEKKAWIECGEREDACHGPRAKAGSSCDQVNAFHDKHCNNPASSGHQQYPCEVHYPVLTHDGHLFTRLVPISTSLRRGDRDQQQRSQAEEAVQVKGEAPSSSSNTQETGVVSEPAIVAGKTIDGFCYVNDTHYIAGTGRYWDRLRPALGWYQVGQAAAPKPDTQSFGPCYEGPTTDPTTVGRLPQAAELAPKDSAILPKKREICVLNDTHYYAEPDQYYNIENSDQGWYRADGAQRLDTAGFEPCFQKPATNWTAGRLARAAEPVAKPEKKNVVVVVGKEQGHCVLNATHYYAEPDRYYNMKNPGRGWYSVAGVPAPETADFGPCEENPKVEIPRRGDGCKPPKVTFRLLAKMRPGYAVKLVGDLQEMGNWNPEKAMPMDTSEYSEEHPVLKDAIMLKPGRFQYKYVMVGPEGQVVWEAGEKRNLEVQGGCQVRTEDWRGGGG